MSVNENNNIDDSIELCEGHHMHPHISPSQIPGDEILYSLAELYKVFGDPTRIRILYALSTQELCVCDIADLLGMTQSAISHQLRVLKQSHLVKFRREGKTVFYSLADAHVYTILAQGLEHVKE
jgi:DNA-binding transcriptional ArsR family regulator